MIDVAITHQTVKTHSQTASYLWTMKVCRQHNDWVSKDVCRVSTCKEGLSAKLKGNAKWTLISQLELLGPCDFNVLPAKLTLDCIQDILQQISPSAGQSSGLLQGAGTPPGTSATQTQSPCPGSPFGPRRRTSPLYWNGHYPQGILPLESKRTKYLLQRCNLFLFSCLTCTGSS